MECIILAAAVALLALWLFSLRQRLTVLAENADQALARFSTQQSSCFGVLAALLALTEEHAPGELLVQSDSIQLRRDRISTVSTPEEAEKKELIMSGILTQIIKVVQTHPKMQADGRYFNCMGRMSVYESLSRTGRLLYNDNVSRLNRELLLFPASIIGRMSGIQKREYVQGPGEDPPIYSVFPPSCPCADEGLSPPAAGQKYKTLCDEGVLTVGAPTVTSVYGSDNSLLKTSSEKGRKT